MEDNGIASMREVINRPYSMSDEDLVQYAMWVLYGSSHGNLNLNRRDIRERVDKGYNLGYSMDDNVKYSSRTILNVETVILAMIERLTDESRTS